MARFVVAALIVSGLAGCDALAGFAAGDILRTGDAARPADSDSTSSTLEGGTLETGTLEAGTGEASAPEAGGADLGDIGAPSDSFNSALCDHSEDQLDIPDATMGGIVFDPQSALAYSAGVSATGKLTIYTIAACEATLRRVRSTAYAPNNLRGDGFTRRTDVTITTLAGTKRLCLAGGGRDLQDTLQLFLGCMRIGAGGVLNDTTRAAKLLAPTGVERVRVVASSTSINVLARSVRLIYADESATPNTADLGTAFFGGLALRGGEILAASGNSSTVAYTRYPPGCTTSGCISGSDTAMTDGDFEVGGFTATSTAAVWVGNDGPTKDAACYYDDGSNPPVHQHFSVKGKLLAAHVIGSTLYAVGQTADPAPLMLQAPLSDLKSDDDQDWKSHGKGELVGLTDIYQGSLLASGTFETRKGVVLRCPLKGCTP